jgi:radical SAM protein with 4Fe4S-binding SPASM domain
MTEAKAEELSVCGPIDRNNTLVQYFRPPDDYFSGLSLRFGTYRKALTHRLRFQLDFLDEAASIRGETPKSTPLFLGEVEAAGISDGEWFHLYFPTIASSKGKLFALTISSTDAEDGEALTAWLSCAGDRIPGHVVCRAGHTIAEGLGLQASLITGNPAAAPPYPRGLLYSPFSSCNMNCTHCISRHSRQRAIHMPASVRQDVEAHVDSEQLHWMFTDYSGDIFFADHSNPGELDFILGLGIAIHIDTNGAYLDAARIERIMKSPVDALSISVDAARDETYHAIRIGSPPIDRIFATAEAVVAARTEHGREKDFRIYMGFTLMLSNLHELPLFIQKAAKAGVDAIGCRHLEVYHADMERESLVRHKQYFNSMRAACIALAKTLEIELLIGEELRDQPRAGGKNPCLLPWDSAVVLANGDVMACCVPGSKMGNVCEQSLESIWQSEGYRRLRTRVNSNDPPSLCKHCPYRGPIDNGDAGEFLRVQQISKSLLEDLMVDEKSI